MNALVIPFPAPKTEPVERRALRALIERFGHSWDFDEHIAHRDLVRFLVKEGFDPDDAADAAYGWQNYAPGDLGGVA